MEQFRLLTSDDVEEYHEVLVSGYAAHKDYPISFDAIEFDFEKSVEWVKNHPVYGLFVDGKLVCSITFRMPWEPDATPMGYPHIAHFVTAPEEKGKGYARKTLAYAEDKLVNVFKTRFVTLGTASEHPWLKDMYVSFGFKEFGYKHFPGKQHTTTFFEKQLY